MGNTQLDFQWRTAHRLGAEAFFITLCSNNEPLITVKWIILVPQVARDRAISYGRMNRWMVIEQQNRTMTMLIMKNKSLVTRRANSKLRLTKVLGLAKDTLRRWTFLFILHAPLIVSVIHCGLFDLFKVFMPTHMNLLAMYQIMLIEISVRCAMTRKCRL